MRFGGVEGAAFSSAADVARVVRAFGFALAGSEIFFNESRWSFRSPLSKYLTGGAGFLDFLTGTVFLPAETPGNPLVPPGAIDMPAQECNRRL
jgi:hypothetical protein